MIHSNIYMRRNIILSSFGKFRDTNQSHLLDWILSSDNPITWLNFFSLLNRPPATSSLLLLLRRRAKHTSSIISQQSSVANESVQSKDMSITGQQMANPGCQIPVLCVVGEHTRSATGSRDSLQPPTMTHTQTHREWNRTDICFDKISARNKLLFMSLLPASVLFHRASHHAEKEEDQQQWQQYRRW